MALSLRAYSRDSGRDRPVVAVRSFCSASVLGLQCSLSQLSVDQSFIKFPSLTAPSLSGLCLIGGFRSRSTVCSTSSFFL